VTTPKARPSPSPVSGVDTLGELLASRASQGTEQCTFLFLDDNGQESSRMTPGEMLEASRQVAAGLARRHAPGERAIVIEPDARDFMVEFFGCVLAGMVPVPAAPPFPARIERAMPRLRAIAANAGASLLLTSAGLEETAKAIFGGAENDTPVMTARQAAAAAAEGADAWQPVAVDPDSPAYLQYTSGSTAGPRGVMVTHRNVLTYLPAMASMSPPGELDENSVMVSWLPLFHDMGLITSLLNALYSGYRSVVMSPLTFLFRPLTWLEAFDRYRGTGAAAPNFAFDLCVARTTPEERAALDLSSWRTAWNGGEPIRPSTLRNFTEAFSPSQLRPQAMRPCYGLAEVVLCASTNTIEPPAIHQVDLEDLRRGIYRLVPPGATGIREVVSCGRVLPGERVEIVDPQTRRPLAEGRVGEIWISSEMVAPGYWGSDDPEGEVFGARLVGEEGGPRFLRTGDLAAMLDGQLCLVGRVKDMIIIRGENYFPIDIELAAERAHPQVRAGCVVASTIGDLGEERLMVVAEVDASEAEALREIVQAIRREVAAACGLLVQRLGLVAPRAVLKTSSGKLRRAGTRDAYAAGELSLLAGWEAEEPGS
jgi:acyl-CoA synthetase (AMP-forming)/AMP-acid ligase II